MPIETSKHRPIPSAATAFCLVAALVLSLLAAFWAAAQLAYFGGAQGLVVMGSVTLTFAVFADTYWRARGQHAFDKVALAMLAFTVILGPIGVELFGRLVNTDQAGPHGLPYLNLVPVSIAIVIQWRLVRWRWLATRGLHEASRWPWIATAAGTMFMLSRFELRALDEAIHGQAHLPELFLGELAILIVAGLIEAGFKRWLWRRLDEIENGL